MKTLDERELQKQQKKNESRQKRARGTEAIVKGWELNDSCWLILTHVDSCWMYQHEWLMLTYSGWLMLTHSKWVNIASYETL